MLVFVDADVVLADDAVAATVDADATARRLQFVSPYPRQLAGSWLERLVQPLLWWSWLTFLPLRRRRTLDAGRRWPRRTGSCSPSTRRPTATAGGHAAVRDAVVEDMALARALVRSGAHGGFVDGSAIATLPDVRRRSRARRRLCEVGCGARSDRRPAPSRWRRCFSSLAVVPWVLVGFHALGVAGRRRQAR